MRTLTVYYPITPEVAFLTATVVTNTICRIAKPIFRSFFPYCAEKNQANFCFCTYRKIYKLSKLTIGRL
jgi:hypothetical protein